MQRRKGKWKKVLAMLLCTANMLGQVVPITATEAAVITNLAQNAAITTGAADHGYAHLVKENAVDGNPETTDPQEPTEVQDPNVNVAQGKSAVASSEEADTVAADNATDENTTDRTSRWGSKCGDAPHWIYVDLEETTNIKNIRIFWENRKATE